MEVKRLADPAVGVPTHHPEIHRELRTNPNARTLLELAVRLADARLPEKQREVLGMLVASEVGLDDDATPADIETAIIARSRAPRGVAGVATLSSFLKRLARRVRERPDKYPANQRAALQRLLSDADALRKAYLYYLKEVWQSEGITTTEGGTHDSAELAFVNGPAARFLHEGAERCDARGCSPFPHFHCQRCKKAVVSAGGVSHVDDGVGVFRSVGVLCDRCGVRTGS